MDKTKKIVLSFIIISFIGIFSISLYNSFTSNNQETIVVQKENEKSEATKKSNDTKETENQEENIETETENQTDSKAETKKDKESENKTKKEETTDSKKTSENKSDSNTTTSKDTTSKQESTQNTQQNTTSDNQQPTTEVTPSKPVETKKVYVQVIGTGNTMMQGYVEIKDGDTAYSVLKKLASQKGQSVSTSGFGSAIYVRGIGGLYEKDYGALSGWMYSVNGVSPNKGAAAYSVSNNDSITWYYVNYE